MEITRRLDRERRVEKVKWKKRLTTKALRFPVSQFE